jgi:hypothetical protein
MSLCEGNHCQGGTEGKHAGNGRIIVMERTFDGRLCFYKTVAVVELPREAFFEDFSDVSIRCCLPQCFEVSNARSYNDAIYLPRVVTFFRHGRWMAVVSQQNSALWIGEITHVPEDEGVIQLSKGTVYDFPRDNDCRIEYCNIEGVDWEGSNRLTFVSDKMKSKGAQSFTCWKKDQSIHTFLIPDEYA